MIIPDIYFYDFEFNLLHVENQFLSSNWSLYYNAIGQFEAHFDLLSDVVSVVMNNQYLIVVQDKKAAVVTGKMALNDLAVYGRTCNWLLTRRTTPPFNQKTGTVETLTKEFVQTAFSDVSNFIVDNTSLYNKSISFWRNVIHPTFDVVSECLDNDSAGHEVVFDVKNKC